MSDEEFMFKLLSDTCVEEDIPYLLEYGYIKFHGDGGRCLLYKVLKSFNNKPINTFFGAAYD